MKRRSYFEKNASLMRQLLLMLGIGFYLLSIPVYSYASDAVSMQQQNIVVSGKIVDQSGNPIPGVNVLIIGTTTGTISDAVGRYSLSVASSQRLMFSFIGFNNQSIDVNNRTTIDVVMVEDLKQVGEVVVVGYGTQKKENLTGAVATVNVKTLESRPIADVGRVFREQRQG